MTGPKATKPTICMASTAMILLASALAMPHQARAQDGDDDASKKLQEVQENIETVKSRKKGLEKAVGELISETEKLSGHLVATASKIQAREAEITAGEDRLRGLTEEETGLHTGLNLKRNQLARLLAGLQRLEQDPPPPLVVRPADALAALRGAMLLGSVVPELRAQSARLVVKLARLTEIRTSIRHEQGELTKKLSELDGERREIAHLLEQKQTLTQTITQELETEQKKVKNLAKKAKSLKDLLGKIEQARVAAEQARKVAAEAEKAEQERQRKLQLAKFMKPTIKFSLARGKLYYPAQGSRVKNFGEKDDLGEKSEGLSIATRQFAQITTPSDGWVAYAGEFRGYGQLLIINAGEGYHVLLAGMEKIAVEVGQFVRAGEPVGSMGIMAIRSAAINAPADSTNPILYVEFRKNGNAVNPRPWWAGNDEKVRG